jgi:hypothetical protein
MVHPLSFGGVARGSGEHYTYRESSTRVVHDPIPRRTVMRKKQQKTTENNTTSKFELDLKYSCLDNSILVLN